MPALLTKISIFFISLITALYSAPIPSRFSRSNGNKCTSALPQSCFTFSSSFSRLAVRTRVAPNFESCIANSLPIPEDAPVIQITLFL